MVPSPLMVKSMKNAKCGRKVEIYIYIYIYVCCLVKEQRANGGGVDEAWYGYVVPEECHNVDLW